MWRATWVQARCSVCVVSCVCSQGVLICAGDELQGYLGASTDELTRRLVLSNRGKGRLQGMQGYHY